MNAGAVKDLGKIYLDLSSIFLSLIHVKPLKLLKPLKPLKLLKPLKPLKLTHLISTPMQNIQLSKHFHLQEFIKSATATKLAIDNTPPSEAVQNLKYLVTNVLEPARRMLGLPIYVNSGYRSPELNAAVGGARNSQHLLGQAADITTGSTKTNLQLALLIAHGNGGLPFDQLILEHCDRNMFPKWLHISYSPIRNRMQIIYT